MLRAARPAAPAGARSWARLQSARSIDHVVNQHGAPAIHVADQVHDLGFTVQGS